MNPKAHMRDPARTGGSGSQRRARASYARGPSLQGLALLLVVLALGTEKSVAQHRSDNAVMMGIMTAPAASGVEILDVLPESPASRAGLAVGDRLMRLHGESVAQPLDVDAILGKIEPGTTVDVELERRGERARKSVQLIARVTYRGRQLGRGAQAETGFEAPPWRVYAWGNVAEGESPPTAENTRGKVVIIHAFQSW